MESTATAKKIQAREVTGEQFRVMLGRHLEPMGSLKWDWDFPNEILEHLHVLSVDYQQSAWRYYELSNEGFYMAPDSPPLRVCMNQTAEMTGDAAGITTCLFVLEGLGVLDTSLSHHHKRLQAFADQHAEAELIHFVNTEPTASNDVSEGMTP